MLFRSILPYDQIDFEMVMETLAENGFLIKYQVDGEFFGWLPTFLKHQQIPFREAASKLPEYNENNAIAVQLHCNCSVIAVQLHCSDSEKSVVEGKGKGTGREQEGKGIEAGQIEIVASDKPKRPAAKKTDDDLLEEIRNNPAYQGIDLEVEIGKMQAWCKVNNRLPTARRLINWLNRIDRPLQAATGQRPAGPKTFDQIKMDNIKQAMAEFAGGDYDGPGQTTVCLANGGNGRSIQSGHEQGNYGDILQAPD